MATENPFVKLFSIDFKDHVEVKKSGKHRCTRGTNEIK